jgi:signal transduction histidine kinase
MAEDPVALVGFHGEVQRTALSQIGLATFGETVPFFLLQGFTAAILILAANTAFNGFPVLSSLLGRDGYLPHQLSHRGDRLVFSNGIVALAAVTALLIVAFDADVTRLIRPRPPHLRDGARHAAAPRPRFGRVVGGRAGRWSPPGKEAPLQFDVPIGASCGSSAAARRSSPKTSRVLRAFAAASETAFEGRRLNEQARHARELATVDRQRTALLAAVGHDLRTPLAGIKAAVSSLRQGDITWSDSDRDELLATIEQSADRLDAVVANLLDASGTETNYLRVYIAQLRRRLEPDPSNPRHLITEPGLGYRFQA